MSRHALAGRPRMHTGVSFQWSLSEPADRRPPKLNCLPLSDICALPPCKYPRLLGSLTGFTACRKQIELPATAVDEEQLPFVLCCACMLSQHESVLVSRYRILVLHNWNWQSIIALYTNRKRIS